MRFEVLQPALTQRVSGRFLIFSGKEVSGLRRYSDIAGGLPFNRLRHFYAAFARMVKTAGASRIIGLKIFQVASGAGLTVRYWHEI